MPDPAGWYPALVPDPGARRVHGFVHSVAASFTADDLARLDAFEGLCREDPARSEYLRRSVTVTIVEHGQIVTAQAYCYNAPLPCGAEPIRERGFAAWLARTGRGGFTD